MQIQTILDHIDSGYMALPEFQRGYVWSREQVRGLFQSLYRRHPVGSLLVWATEAAGADHRGDGELAPGVVKLLLDGQQRITSLYGVIRGKPPKFFDGNAKAFTGLRFHLETETFGFYQPVKMRDDPLWIDVTKLMKEGIAGFGEYMKKIAQMPDKQEETGRYFDSLSRLFAIREIEMHIDEVTGTDKTVDVVVEIFNRVNSGGTKLSKGDLALAKVCADWPQAREIMKGKLQTWKDAGYDFKMEWLLRSVNTVLTGKAQFLHLHDQSAEAVKQALERTVGHIDAVLEMISSRLGLDHNRVFFGRYAVPVMVRFLDKFFDSSDLVARDRLLFWYLQSGMWGRFSGSTESVIDRDIAVLEKSDGNLLELIEQLRLSHGGLRVEPGHFHASGLGGRFYPLIYMMTRMGEALDWGTGKQLKIGTQGRTSALDVHQIFPKSQLYEHEFASAQVNAIANFCFLTRETNFTINDRLPEDYFSEVEARHPGALKSQWIPDDRGLWKIDAYLDFLEARKALLAEEANRILGSLMHDREDVLEGAPSRQQDSRVPGGISTKAEEEDLEALNAWMVERGFAPGEIQWDYSDPSTGNQKAVFDLVWPEGVQEGLSGPVAVLLNETADVLTLASEAGLRPFTSVDAFKRYVENELLGGHEIAAE